MSEVSKLPRADRARTSRLQVKRLCSCDSCDSLILQSWPGKVNPEGVLSEFCSLVISKVGLEANAIVINSIKTQLIPTGGLIGLE